MTRLLLFSLIFFAIDTFSCKPRDTSKDSDQIAKSYGIIHHAFATTKETQGNFFAAATESLATIKYTREAVVDTRKLKLLLDSAKDASQIRINALNLADEVDDQIKYKEKALKYVMLLDTLYRNEFVQFVNILESNTEDRFEKSQRLLLQKMQDMSKAMHDCQDAGDEVRQKYNVPVLPSNE